MVTFNYVVDDYDEAVRNSKNLTANKLRNSIFKPILLYLRELRGDDVYEPDFGLRNSVDDIRENSNMYFQLVNEDSKNVRYFENGMMCEPDSDYHDTAMIFLLNGSIYLIDQDYEESIYRASELLGKPLRRIFDESIVSKAKNKVVEERKKAIVNNLIKHLETALGMNDEPGVVRFEAKAVDTNLEPYSSKQSTNNGNSR